MLLTECHVLVPKVITLVQYSVRLRKYCIIFDKNTYSLTLNSHSLRIQSLKNVTSEGARAMKRNNITNSSRQLTPTAKYMQNFVV